MDQFRDQIKQSLQKILCPMPQIIPRTPLRKRLYTSFRLESLTFRKLQPAVQSGWRLQVKTKQEGKRMKPELRCALSKYTHSRNPTNASQSRYESVGPSLRCSQHEIIDSDKHLSYRELIVEQQKQEQRRRLTVLKRVFQENARKRNEEMKKLKSKTRIRTIM